MKFQISSRRENRSRDTWVIKIRILIKVFSKQFCFIRCRRQYLWTLFAMITNLSELYLKECWLFFFSCDHVLSHIIQQNLAVEIEWLSSLKFPATQNFQIPAVINYLPPLNFVQTSYLAEILYIWWYHPKKCNMSSFNYISYWL